MLLVGRYKKELTERSYDEIVTVGKVLNEVLEVKVCVKVLVGREDDNEVISVGEHNKVLIGRGYDEGLILCRGCMMRH